MFTEKDIRHEVGRSITFEKAQRLSQNGSVLDMDLEEFDIDGEFYINGTIQGSYDNEYAAWILVNSTNGTIEDYACDCPAFLSYPGMCKHCAALALEFLEQQNSRKHQKPGNPDRENCEENPG